MMAHLFEHIAILLVESDVFERLAFGKSFPILYFKTDEGLVLGLSSEPTGNPGRKC